jgi:hypothetical protein
MDRAGQLSLRNPDLPSTIGVQQGNRGTMRELWKCSWPQVTSRQGNSQVVVRLWLRTRSALVARYEAVHAKAWSGDDALRCGCDTLQWDGVPICQGANSCDIRHRLDLKGLLPAR